MDRQTPYGRGVHSPTEKTITQNFTRITRAYNINSHTGHTKHKLALDRQALYGRGSTHHRNGFHANTHTHACLGQAKDVDVCTGHIKHKIALGRHMGSPLPRKRQPHKDTNHMKRQHTIDHFLKSRCKSVIAFPQAVPQGQLNATKTFYAEAHEPATCQHQATGQMPIAANSSTHLSQHQRQPTTIATCQRLPPTQEPPICSQNRSGRLESIAILAHPA